MLLTPKTIGNLGGINIKHLETDLLLFASMTNSTVPKQMSIQTLIFGTFSHEQFTRNVLVYVREFTVKRVSICTVNTGSRVARFYLQTYPSTQISKQQR